MFHSMRGLHTPTEMWPNISIKTAFGWSDGSLSGKSAPRVGRKERPKRKSLGFGFVIFIASSFVPHRKPTSTWHLFYPTNYLSTLRLLFQRIVCFEVNVKHNDQFRWLLYRILRYRILHSDNFWSFSLISHHVCYLSVDGVIFCWWITVMCNY